MRSGARQPRLVKVSQASLQDDSLPRFIGEQLLAHGVPGEYLVLQLPEAKVFTNLKAAQEFAAAISRHDCRIGLEQFGVGLDSFQLLAHLQPHLLKLDRSFVEERPRSDNQRASAISPRRPRISAIRTLAEFGHTLRMSSLFTSGVDYVEKAIFWRRRRVMN